MNVFSGFVTVSVRGLVGFVDLFKCILVYFLADFSNQ